MKNILLARRYAKALFDLAVEDGKLEAVKDDMKLVADVMTENRPLRRMMASPVIPPVRKNAVIKKVFEGKIDKRSQAFLDILIRKGREEQIHDIAQQFYESYLEYKNIAIVEVTTASAIDGTLSSKMLKVMEARTQKTLQLQQKIDPEIIGGFKLRMQDYQYDASISKVISRLHKEFDKNLFIKGF
ncbi:MAG: ATP synthase F1 subunit delta [Bacteroidales bacterium]|jgi:F-type H+-transporting ATPase subunit delta|nr:ATP synthase F1 subunit delta [Bacteroidales bacterium]HOI32406.1 ATP synthase F1 subunit delta [Bacteroidales bacterium]